ncbi:MAG: hypothetical protein PHH58_13130 [Rhodoferax sp.]|nr:hypothetical protein [Rhodoferax sp.]
MKILCVLLRGLAIAGFTVTAALAGEGQVVSTMDSAGYTYIEVEQNGQKDWLAAETIKVSVGQKIQFEEFSMMSNFRSESLQRTFATMRFVNTVKVVPSAPIVPAK